MLRFNPGDTAYFYNDTTDRVIKGAVIRPKIIEHGAKDYELCYDFEYQNTDKLYTVSVIPESLLGINAEDAIENARAYERNLVRALNAKYSEELRTRGEHIDHLTVLLEKHKQVSWPEGLSDDKPHTLKELLRAHDGMGPIGYAEIPYMGLNRLFGAHLTKKHNISYRYYCPGSTACLVKDWPTVYSRSKFWPEQKIWTRAIPPAWKKKIEQDQEQGVLL